MKRMGFRLGRDIRLTKRETGHASFAIRVRCCRLHWAADASLAYSCRDAHCLLSGFGPGHSTHLRKPRLS